MIFIELNKPRKLCVEKYTFKSKNETEEHGRMYTFDCGSFPSVTTVLSKTADETWLELWRIRVGEEKAHRISQLATIRGSLMHDALERLALGERINMLKVMPTCARQVKAMHGLLEQNVTLITGIETPIVDPHNLKVAGRTDLLGHWNHVPSVIDYKTSKKVKTADQIEDYFVQTTMYGLMCLESTDFVPQQIVVLIACDDGQVLTFIRPMSDFIEHVKHRIKTYYGST